MKDKKGLEMTIGTLIVLVLAVLVLITLITAFTIGWERFWETIGGYFGNEMDNLSRLCQNQCNLNQENSFCCEEKNLGEEKITCSDERLSVDCNINCENIC